jgi:hypothetical protein
MISDWFSFLLEDRYRRTVIPDNCLGIDGKCKIKKLTNS